MNPSPSKNTQLSPKGHITVPAISKHFTGNICLSGMEKEMRESLEGKDLEEIILSGGRCEVELLEENSDEEWVFV